MAAAESAPSGGRAYPMQEFVAHSGPVRVARLGTKSGQVLATGGEDKRVNVWKIGRTSALMSLSGHSSAIDALTFDRTEETLVAGCSGGSLKIWSLEAQKVLPATCSRYSYFEPGTLQTAKIARFLK